MKKLLLLFFILITSFSASADIFDRAKSQNNKNLLQEAINQDDRGYYYSAYNDWNMRTPPDDPKLRSTTSASFGCSNFDFQSNFLNQFQLSALSNTVSNFAKNTLAASPMLLLEYASPTMADLVKHFSTTSNLKLGLLYAQCEDIENSVGDELVKLRKKSEQACVSSKEGADLDTAMKECKAQSDPFAYLKDSKGAYLINGGEINVLENVLNKVNLDNSKQQEILKRSPNKIISSTKINNTGSQEGIETVFYNNRVEAFDNINTLYDSYTDNPDSVTQDQLDKISIPGVPITKKILRDLSLFGKYDRQLKFSQIASSLAAYKTINTYREYINAINSAKLVGTLDETETEYLDRLTKYYEDSVQTIKTNIELRRDSANIVLDAITESDRRRLEMMRKSLESRSRAQQADRDAIDKGFLFLGK